MLNSLKEMTANNLIGVCTVGEKIVNITINNSSINGSLSLNELGNSSLNISINILTGKSNMIFNNIDSVQDIAIFIDLLMKKLQSILTEIESF